MDNIELHCIMSDLEDEEQSVKNCINEDQNAVSKNNYRWLN